LDFPEDPYALERAEIEKAKKKKQDRKESERKSTMKKSRASNVGQINEVNSDEEDSDDSVKEKPEMVGGVRINGLVNAMGRKMKVDGLEIVEEETPEEAAIRIEAERVEIEARQAAIEAEIAAAKARAEGSDVDDEIAKELGLDDNDPEKTHDTVKSKDKNANSVVMSEDMIKE